MKGGFFIKLICRWFGHSYKQTDRQVLMDVMGHERGFYGYWYTCQRCGYKMYEGR